MADMPRSRATRNDGAYDLEANVESFLDKQNFFSSLIQEKPEEANSYNCFSRTSLFRVRRRVILSHRI